MPRAFALILSLLALVKAVPARAGLPDPPDGATADTLPEPRPPAAETAWSKVKEIDGVVIDRAPSPNEREPWSRGTATIDAPFARVVAHILEFDNLTRFVPRIIAARVVWREDPEAVVYYRLDLPWPLSDRHWTVHYRWQLEKDHFLLAWSDANHRQPLDVKQAVVVQVVRGTWELVPASPTTTYGRIVQLISLGGWMPKSVIDETVWKQPLQTFRGIRRATAP